MGNRTQEATATLTNVPFLEDYPRTPAQLRIEQLKAELAEAYEDLKLEEAFGILARRRGAPKESSHDRIELLKKAAGKPIRSFVQFDWFDWEDKENSTYSSMTKEFNQSDCVRLLIPVNCTKKNLLIALQEFAVMAAGDTLEFWQKGCGMVPNDFRNSMLSDNAQGLRRNKDAILPPDLAPDSEPDAYTADINDKITF